MVQCVYPKFCGSFGHEMTLLAISYTFRLNIACNLSLGCFVAIGFCLVAAPTESATLVSNFVVVRTALFFIL